LQLVCTRPQTAANTEAEVVASRKVSLSGVS